MFNLLALHIVSESRKINGMNDVFTMQQRIAELEKQLKYEREASIKKDAKIAYLYEQFRLAQQKQFGKSAEGFVGQGELFNELCQPTPDIDSLLPWQFKA